ncbi:MAG: beta/gamma crystallin-related protein, partial [Burkholderiales bacterium]
MTEVYSPVRQRTDEALPLAYCADLKEVPMTSTVHALLGTTLLAFGVHAAAQVTYYEGEHFQGRAATTTTRTTNLERSGYRERASSVVVTGAARWQVCDDTRLSGHCMVLRPGRYADPQAMG